MSVSRWATPSQPRRIPAERPSELTPLEPRTFQDVTRTSDFCPTPPNSARVCLDRPAVPQLAYLLRNNLRTVRFCLHRCQGVHGGQSTVADERRAVAWRSGKLEAPEIAQTDRGDIFSAMHAGRAVPQILVAAAARRAATMMPCSDKAGGESRPRCTATALRRAPFHRPHPTQRTCACRRPS